MAKALTHAVCIFTFLFSRASSVARCFGTQTAVGSAAPKKSNLWWFMFTQIGHAFMTLINFFSVKYQPSEMVLKHSFFSTSFFFLLDISYLTAVWSSWSVSVIRRLHMNNDHWTRLRWQDVYGVFGQKAYMTLPKTESRGFGGWGCRARWGRELVNLHRVSIWALDQIKQPLFISFCHKNWVHWSTLKLWKKNTEPKQNKNLTSINERLSNVCSADENCIQK